MIRVAQTAAGTQAFVYNLYMNTTVTAICPVGNHEFTYQPRANGRPRIYCSSEHTQLAWRQREASKPERRCSRCKQEKPQSEFAGIAASYCKLCFAKYKRSTPAECIREGCHEPKTPGRGSRLCAAHRATAEKERTERQAMWRNYQQHCRWPGCTDDKESSRKWYCSEHAEQAAERKAERRRNDPTRQPSHVAARTRVREHGLTEEQYRALIAAQDGRCAMCRERPGKRQLSIDHDHHRPCGHTGRASCDLCRRELLCGRCNPLLGYAQDDISVLEAAIAYLKKHAMAAPSSL